MMYVKHVAVMLCDDADVKVSEARERLDWREDSRHLDHHVTDHKHLTQLRGLVVALKLNA